MLRSNLLAINCNGAQRKPRDYASNSPWFSPPQVQEFTILLWALYAHAYIITPNVVNISQATPFAVGMWDGGVLEAASEV